ncbi:anti-sigma factor, partial [Aliivibrio sifiae]
MNKITHHPSDALLRSHVDGDLPESLAVGMTLHCDLCEHCKRKSDKLTQEFAAKAWQEPAEAESVDFSQMLNGILNTEVETSYLKEPSVEHIFIDSFHYELPRV